MPKENEENIQSSIPREPNIAELQDSYKNTLADLGAWVDQSRLNFEVRHNIWPGQSNDQRKHGPENDPPFPWEGASDLKTFIVDDIINTAVSGLTSALQRSRFTAIPVEASDTRRSKLVTDFMTWLIKSQITELRREAEILANYREEKGMGILGIFWERKVELVRVDLTIEEMAERAPEAAKLIEDPLLKDLAIDMIQSAFPSLKRRTAGKVVTDLRSKGLAKVPKPQVTRNRPRVRAYTLDDDFFFPINSTSLQAAPFIFMAEYFTADQLRNKVITEGWKEDFVDEVIEKALGKDLKDAPVDSSSRVIGRDKIFGFDNPENLARVVCAYERGVDEDGIPGIWYTVFHPDLGTWGVHELFNYEPLRYPFVEFPRERRSRRILDTRGTPEIAKGWQDEVKVQRDSRIDRAQLATCPPREYPLGRKPVDWGPGTYLPTRRRGEYGFAEIPPFDQGSIEMESNILTSIDKYFGKPTSEEDVIEAQIKGQKMVDDWLEGWRTAYNHVFQIYNQFGPEEEFFRVIGSEEDSPERYIKSNSADKYDFYLDFNILNQDANLQLDRIEKIGDLMGRFDRGGQSDFGGLLRVAIETLDPVLADRLLIPSQAASNKEIEETQSDLAKIASGQHVNPPQQANAQLRLQTVEGYFQGTPAIPAQDVQQRLQQDEPFRTRIENYTQQLQQQIQQQRNAQTGALGAEAGNSLPTNI